MTNFLAVVKFDTITTFKEYQKIITGLLMAGTSLEICLDPDGKEIIPAHAGWQLNITQKTAIPETCLTLKEAKSYATEAMQKKEFNSSEPGYKITREFFKPETTFEEYQKRIMALLEEGKRLFPIITAGIEKVTSLGPNQGNIECSIVNGLWVIEKLVCPKCGGDLQGLYFLGDKSEPPEFISCPTCGIAYDPVTMKPAANVIS